MELKIKLSDDNKLSMEADKPLTFLETTDLMLSTLLAMMEAIYDNAPKEQQPQIKEHLFETFNIAASALLAQFAPELDLRPDLTEEAIFEKELEIAFNKHND